MYKTIFEVKDKVQEHLGKYEHQINLSFISLKIFFNRERIQFISKNKNKLLFQAGQVKMLELCPEWSS